MPSDAVIPADVLIFGGGIAGLWLLDELRRRGAAAYLLEVDRLGAGQTVAAQGIIHGGLKYTLDGLFNPSAEAIREMPSLWRACLSRAREPYLPPGCLRSEHCYLWRTSSLRSQLGMLGARMGLRVVPQKLARGEMPAILADCPGEVLRLDEQVIDPVEVLSALRQANLGRLLKVHPSGLEFSLEEPGRVRAVHAREASSERRLELRPSLVVLTAGAGNAGLRERVGLDPLLQQIRPLHMVMVRGSLAPLNGHCTDGARTRVTISSAVDSARRTVWQLGGQIAEAGVAQSPNELMQFAARELEAVLSRPLPRDLEWTTYRVDRAEPRTPGNQRPSDVYFCREGNVLTCWPTKLALAPRLAERVSESIGLHLGRSVGSVSPVEWEAPAVALPPWELPAPWTRLQSGAPA